MRPLSLFLSRSVCRGNPVPAAELTIWLARTVLDTRSMTNIPYSSPKSFRQLPVEAKALVFIYASAAWARFNPNIPDQSVLLSEIEKVWCIQKLSAEAVSDPDRMTRLLEEHFESLRSELARRVASRMCRSRVSE